MRLIIICIFALMVLAICSGCEGRPMAEARFTSGQTVCHALTGEKILLLRKGVNLHNHIFKGRTQTLRVEWFNDIELEPCL